MLAGFEGIITTYAFNIQIIVSAVCLILILREIKFDLKNLAILALHIVGVTAALELFSFAVYCLFFYSKISNLWQSLAVFVVYTLYTIFFCKTEWKIKTILSFTLFGSLLIVIEMGGMLSFLLFDVISSALVRTLCLLLLIPFVFIVKRFDLRSFDTVYVFLFVIVMLFNAIVVVVTCLNSYVCMHEASPTWFNAVIMFAMYGILFVVYIMNYAVVKTLHESLILYFENNFAKTNAQMLELLQKSNEDLRCIRHDIRNQYAYMDVLLDGERYDELKKYFRTLNNNFSVADNYIETGNINVNSVMNMQRQKAAMQNIKIDCNAVVPQILPFSDVDLCSLLTNLLDNAIEACLRQNIKNAVIETIMGVQGSNLYISVKNPIRNDVDINKLLQLRTVKTEAGHGLGTKIVQRIAYKYGGDASFSVIDNQFTAEVILNFRNAKEENNE